MTTEMLFFLMFAGSVFVTLLLIVNRGRQGHD